MTDRSRQDRTRSPMPNELANLYLQQAELVAERSAAWEKYCKASVQLREVDAAIKRACGDRETQMPENDDA